MIAALLNIPRMGNPYLSEAAYLSLTQALSNSSQDDVSSKNIASQISEILKVITTSQPSQAETHILPSWLNAVGQTMLFYYSVDKEGCSKECYETISTNKNGIRNTKVMCALGDFDVHVDEGDASRWGLTHNYDACQHVCAWF